MNNTEQRLAANRANALKSTGPVTAAGKATVSRNATRHGLLSAKLFLDDEDPAVFQHLLDELGASLNSVGVLESSLVERIAITIWRQRRLVQAETASLGLTHQPNQIAKAVSSELRGGDVKPDDLVPFDADHARWCQDVVAEIEAADEIDLRSLQQRAPLIYAQLLTDADDEDLATFTAAHDGGLTGYMGELLLYCRKKLREAEARPRLLAIAAQVRSKRLMLPADALELLARYQSSLDNQMFKLLRALRDAQEWRLKTLEPTGRPATCAVEEETVGVAA
jgi:hypothetical protein